MVMGGSQYHTLVCTLGEPCTVNVLSSGCGVRYFGMYSMRTVSCLYSIVYSPLCTSKCAMYSVGNGVYSHGPSRVHCTLVVL